MNTEQKTDQQIDYGMEELIPVVAELTEKFTSAESSSVSYERARHLMEAVHHRRKNPTKYWKSWYAVRQQRS